MWSSTFQSFYNTTVQSSGYPTSCNAYPHSCYHTVFTQKLYPGIEIAIIFEYIVCGLLFLSGLAGSLLCLCKFKSVTVEGCHDDGVLYNAFE